MLFKDTYLVTKATELKIWKLLQKFGQRNKLPWIMSKILSESKIEKLFSLDGEQVSNKADLVVGWLSSGYLIITISAA